jgi:hypothetical protein
MRVRRALPLALLLLACDDPVSPPVYDEAEFAYFAEIAFGTEEDPSTDQYIRRWERDVVIAIRGFPSERQVATVHQVARELDELTRGVDVRSLDRGSDASANVDIHFVTRDSMDVLGIPSDDGYVYVWWSGGGAIDSARVHIAYDRGSLDHIDHLIREELTQALGLLRDSWTYPESIFYQGPSSVVAFAPIDRSVIRMLYDQRIDAGMHRDEALEILSGSRVRLAHTGRKRVARVE